jgi:CMP-N-acetylneuraminic acid synthetase
MIRPKILVIIPARKGSKGIPSKNKKELLGKPLVSYTFDIASKLDENYVTYVSSDDEEIIKIANGYNIKNNGLRPDNISDDKALTIDVLHYELLAIEKESNVRFDAVMLLQATCPIRDISHIYEVEKLFIKNNLKSSVVSVKKIDSEHPFRMKRMIQDHILVNYIDQGYEDMRPRQELPPVYIRNGSIYLSPAISIRDKQTLVTSEAYGYLMDNLHSINIDNIEDFLVASFFMKTQDES